MLSSLGGAVAGFPGALIGSAGSKLIDGLFGSDPNKQNKEIMQMQNQFNAQEAQKNRDFQVDMFNRTNSYNSPKAQMQRFMEAGLNPDLMYGNGASSIAAQSPSGSQASGSSPIAAVDMQQRAANVALTQAQTRLIEHQADNLDADTVKKGAETAGILTYNEFQRQLLQGQIDLNGVQIKLGQSQIALNDQQAKVLYETVTKIQKETLVLDKTLDELSAKIRNLDADTALKKIQEVFERESLQPRLDEIASRIGVNKAQVINLIESLAIQRAGLEIQGRLADSQIELNNANKTFITTSNGRLQYDFEIDQGQHSGSFRELERKGQTAGLITKDMNYIVQLISAAFGAPRP